MAGSSGSGADSGLVRKLVRDNIGGDQGWRQRGPPWAKSQLRYRWRQQGAADDQAGRDDRGDTELHEGTAVRGEDDSHPVERVGGIRRHDTVEGHLRADEEDEEGDCRP